MINLVDRLEQLKSLDPDKYLYTLETFVSHLVAAEQYERIQLVFKNHEWMHARLLGSRGKYAGFLQDVQLVLNETIQSASEQINSTNNLPYLSECIRYLLIRTSISSLAGNYPPEVIVRALELDSWDVERAISTALSIPDLDLRALACASLCETAMLNERQRRAFEELVIEAAFSPEDTDLIYHTVRFDALRKILTLISEDRKFPLAERAAKLTLALPDVDALGNSPKALAIASIAPLLPIEQREGYLTIAFDSASRLSTEHSGLPRIQAFEAIFPQVTGELVQRSIDAIFAIESDLNRLPLIRAISAQLKGAVLDDVLQRVQAMEYLKYRILGISTLLPQCESADREKLLEDAWETAVSKAYDDDQRALMLVALVPFRQQGFIEHDLATIYALVSSIEREDDKIETLIQLANVSSGHQRTNLATEALDRILNLTNGSDQAKFIQSVIHLLDADMLRHAVSVFLELHDEISLLKSLASLATRADSDIKAEVLQLCLDMLARLDESDKRQGFENVGSLFVGELLEKAFNIALTIKHDGDRAKAISALADNFDEIDASSAYEASRNMSFEGWRADIICAVAGKLSNKHRKLALDDALSFHYPKYRSEVLTAFIPHIQKDKQDKIKRKALAAALSISEDEYRAEALGSLAPFLDSEQFDRAVNSIQKIAVETARASALAKCALQLTGKRRDALSNEALSLINTIRDDFEKMGALYEIVPILNEEQAEEALQHVLSVKEDWYGAHILVALAPKLHESGFEKALSAAKSITHPLARARTLAGFLKYVNDKEELVVEVRKVFFNYLRSLDTDERGSEERTRVLSLLAEKDILDALDLPQETFGQIAHHVIDVCTRWEWM